MKKMKKLLSLLMAAIMVLAMGTTVFAAENNGSITIQSTVKDKNYDLYKIFDLTYSGEAPNVSAAYTIDSDWTAFFAGAGAEYIVGNNASGNLNQIVVDRTVKYIDVTEVNVVDFAQDALDYASTKTADKTVVGTGGDVTADGLELGYYLVYPRGASVQNENSQGSICSLTSTVPNATINIKATYPEIDKVIDEGNGVTTNTASIGDKVPYKVTGKVPDMTGFTKYYYVVNDTMSKGLTFNGDVVIKIGEATLAKDTDYTVTPTADGDTTKIEIVFKNFIQYKEKAGEAIVVTYSATVNQDAEIGTNPNTNEVILNYSNDPKQNNNGDPGNPDKPAPGDVVGTTPEVGTKTFVSAIALTKVDGSDPSKTLAGAKFSISGDAKKVVIINKEIFQEDAKGTHWRLTDGTYTTTAPVTAEDGYTADKYDSTETKYSKVTVINKDNADSTAIVAEGYVNENGVLTFEGLGEGTYEISELVAPSGYNLLTSPITVLIGFDEDTNTFTATVDGNNATVDNGVIKFNVENNAGVKLPETGGIGTTMFYVIGGLLMLGAVVILVTKKKMSVNEN